MEGSWENWVGVLEVVPGRGRSSEIWRERDCLRKGREGWEGRSRPRPGAAPTLIFILSHMRDCSPLADFWIFKLRPDGVLAS